MILPYSEDSPNQPNQAPMLRSKIKLTKIKKILEHYYKYGNGYIGDPDKKSILKEDFLNPGEANTNITNEKRDTFKLMNTNFTMGDKENPNTAYLTVYKNKLDGRMPKDPVKNLFSKKEITTVKISNNLNNDFLTEKQYK